MPSLAEELPKEQARVRQLVTEYRSIGPAGELGALLMEQSLKKAEVASAAGDVVGMLEAYQALQSHTG